MHTRVELVMLQKTMVVVEGVARKLDPRLDMWKTSEPVVGAWIADNLGPRGKLEDARVAAGKFLHEVVEAPERLAKIGRWIDSWPIDPAPAPPPRSSAALWWIAAALVWIAVKLTWR